VPAPQSRLGSRLCFGLQPSTLRSSLNNTNRNTALAAPQLLLLFSPTIVMTKDYFDPNALVATDSAAVFVNEVIRTTS
jgi:hypothetical protein